MPDFCSENTEVMNDSNYMDKFETKTRKSCLPNGGDGFSSVTSEGIVSKAEVETHLTTLLSQANAVPPLTANSPSESMEPVSKFAENSAKLRKEMTTEYCFYYKRYIYILHDILMSAATLTEGSKPNAYVEKKTNTEKLNSKLNQILQLLQSLVTSRLSTLKGYYDSGNGVNSLNDELDNRRQELVKHSKLLKNTELEKDARSAMVEYSVEKNNSSRNLLAIYGFMNIVAVGLVFYLYKSQ